jgi:hypothetical protein
VMADQAEVAGLAKTDSYLADNHAGMNHAGPCGPEQRYHPGVPDVR